MPACENLIPLAAWLVGCLCQISSDRDVSADVEDINVGTIGARVKF
jgi:hypothetical protein